MLDIFDKCTNCWFLSIIVNVNIINNDTFLDVIYERTKKTTVNTRECVIVKHIPVYYKYMTIKPFHSTVQFWPSQHARHKLKAIFGKYKRTPNNLKLINVHINPHN